MKRHIPGLHRENSNGYDQLDGVFLVRVDRAFYLLRFSILEPEQHRGHSLSGRNLLHAQSTVEIELVLAGLRV